GGLTRLWTGYQDREPSRAACLRWQRHVQGGHVAGSSSDRRGFKLPRRSVVERSNVDALRDITSFGRASRVVEGDHVPSNLPTRQQPHHRRSLSTCIHHRRSHGSVVDHPHRKNGIGSSWDSSVTLRSSRTLRTHGPLETNRSRWTSCASVTLG